jgi:hypothetical protein
MLEWAKNKSSVQVADTVANIVKSCNLGVVAICISECWKQLNTVF